MVFVQMFVWYTSIDNSKRFVTRLIPFPGTAITLFNKVCFLQYIVYTAWNILQNSHKRALISSLADINAVDTGLQVAK